MQAVVPVILLWFGLGVSFGAENRGTLRVGVRDEQGGAIPGAAVALHARDARLQVTAAADPGGGYLFRELSPGDYRVEVTAPGFAPRAQPVRIAPGAAAEVEFELGLSAVEERIVVTASGTAQTSAEISKSLTVLDRADIDARDEFSVAEALRVVPGLRVQQLGGPGAFTAIKTRGLRNEDTQLLVDGAQWRDVAAPQGDASALFEGLLVGQVDRIEVLRGSSSSLHGTHAIGGAINIVTAEAGGAVQGNVLAEGGSLGLFRGRAGLGGGWGENRMAYSFGIAHLNVSEGVDGDDPARSTNAHAMGRWRLGSAASLSARLHALRSRLALNENPETLGSLPGSGIIPAVPLALGDLKRYEQSASLAAVRAGAANFLPSANDPDQRRESETLSARFGFEHRPRPNASYSVNYHRFSTERIFIDGPRGGSFFEPLGASRSDFDGLFHSLRGRADFEWGRDNWITLGYDFESETYRSGSFPGSPEPPSTVGVTQRGHSFLVQDQLGLFQGALQIAGALRGQVFALGAPRFAPGEGAPFRGPAFDAPPSAYTADASAAYHFPSAGTKLRAHVGNGYRAPSLFERFGSSFGSFGYFVFGDPRLAPERSTSLDAGLDQELARGRARASATYFHTWLRDVILFDFSGGIDPSTDPFGRFGGYRNATGGRSRGLELSVQAVPARPLRIALAYTYTDSRSGAPAIEDILRSFGIPKHQFSIVATQRLTDALAAHLDLTASSKYLAPVFDASSFRSRAFEFDGMLETDLGVDYRASLGGANLRIFGKIENLLDRLYFENGFRVPGRTGALGLAVEF
jgi:iron complex outermembrane receptor protein